MAVNYRRKIEYLFITVIIFLAISMYQNDSIILHIPNQSKDWLVAQYVVLCITIISWGFFPTSLDELEIFIMVIFIMVLMYFILVFIRNRYETIIIIKKNEITIQQKLLWVTYFRYIWDFELINIGTQEYDEISFIDKDNDKIMFTWQFGSDFDEPDYFILVIPQKIIDIGTIEQYKDFTQNVKKLLSTS